jgi:hypothetical protein
MVLRTIFRREIGLKSFVLTGFSVFGIRVISDELIPQKNFFLERKH